MRRIRGKQQLEVHYNENTNTYRILNDQNEIDQVNDEGGLDSQQVVEVHFLDCHCRAAAAGKCYLCGGLSCAKCFGHCLRCHKPICPACSIFTNDQDNQPVRLCKQCHDQQRRKRRLGKATRFLLSPFIQFKDSHGK